MKESKKIFRIAIISLFSLAIALSLFFSGSLDQLQEKIYDRLFTSQDISSKVVIVAIDDESIRAIGSWPWPRNVFAKAISNLKKAQKIGIDVSFSEPSARGLLDDEELRQALLENGKKIVLPLQLDSRGGKISGPIALFEGLSDFGIVNVSVGHDGIARHISRYQDYQSFSEAVSNVDVDDQTLRIFYQGKSGAFPSIPFIDVYRGIVPPLIFEDKIVLIGATAPDLHDFLQTPFGLMSGIEIHANLISQLLQGIFFTPTPTYLAVLFIIFASIIATFFIARIKSYIYLSLALFLELIIIIFLSVFLFNEHILFAGIYPLISFFLTSAFLISYQYIVESKEKRFIRKSFEYYLMPEIVDDLVAHPEKLVLGGDRKKITVLFSDIRGFTTISEAMKPEDLAHILNEYLSDMTEAIMKWRGLVDKYIGDAVMAFFGAPIENVNQAADSCYSVLEMAKRLSKLNKHWSSRGLPELKIGVGINTGEAVVGNFGSSRRFNYTVLGDEVNFASRLEGLNKMYGTTCIISESTAKEIENKKDIKIRELDRVVVKGKREPKTIFELIALPPSENLSRSHEHFKGGREFYSKGEWPQAIEEFEKAAKLGDAPSTLFIERCRELSKSPPLNWKGIYEFHSK